MGATLPPLESNQLVDGLAESLGATLVESLAPATIAALLAHYDEMRRWNRRLSLVGPGTAAEVVERHYAESLAALPLVEAAGTLVDVGTGAGFPGLVLAAARPGLDVLAIEPRQRKWAFLESALRKMRQAVRREGGDVDSLSCRIANARVERPLPPALQFPPSIDLVASRALALPTEILSLFMERDPWTRFLLWLGRLDPEPPPGLVIGRRLALPGAEHRRVVELVPSAAWSRTSSN
ncbi:MAG: RsmG family class I SAM-dependent methyltransferase [Acidobacteriota bacterium]